MHRQAPQREIMATAAAARHAHPLQYAPESRPRTYEELWLLGLPPLWRYLEFVESAVVDGERVDRAALTSEWCAANDYYQELESTEAGIANEGSHRELDSCLRPLVESVKAHPHYRRAFDTLATDLGMVELDRLIVCQKHITRTFVDRLMATIGPAPDAETLFRLCLPLDPPEPPVQICKAGPRRYVFRCESTDLRFHETTVLRPTQLQGYDSFGAIAGAVAVLVGFGNGFLSAVRVGKRTLLNNGYHRACALRALGVKHAPCVIQTATRVDELAATVKGRIAEEAELYFESARPPLLKDFFDPRIRKLLPIRAQTHIVEVNLEIRHLVEDPVDTE
jgi:hypothetical protein